MAETACTEKRDTADASLSYASLAGAVTEQAFSLDSSLQDEHQASDDTDWQTWSEGSDSLLQDELAEAVCSCPSL